MVYFNLKYCVKNLLSSVNWLVCMHCTLRTLPPSPPHSNTHCHESSENFLYKIYQVLGILPILINNRSDTVVQWISAGLVWSRTWVQSYTKLDFFSVIGNRISNTSYHFQYLYYPGGNETGAKPNLITCITEIFLSVGFHQRESIGVQDKL